MAGGRVHHGAMVLDAAQLQQLAVPITISSASASNQSNTSTQGNQSSDFGGLPTMLF